MQAHTRYVLRLGCAGVQARKQAEAIEIGMRMDRLAQQAGESMVTTNTLASMDEDDDSALKRFNLILKVGSYACTLIMLPSAITNVKVHAY